VLWSKGATGQRPLVTEALRGAGAVLRDLAGSPVMAGRHPLGDLAPRDIVAAGMSEVMERDGCEHLWLDATGLGRDELERGFPTVTAACRAEGIDPVSDLIPVAPGAHYSCGGIATDLAGRTSLPSLYAVGEAASTGFHGANRLASNSLVEAVIMGRNVAEAITFDRFGRRDSDWGSGGHWPASTGLLTVGDEISGRPAAGRDELAAAMSRYAGVVRDADGLRALLKLAAAVRSPGATVLSQAPVAQSAAVGLMDRPIMTPGQAREVEAANLRAVSLLIAAAALARKESRGCHRRRDAAQALGPARHTLLRWAA
jgi:L-aspartate oxidase